MKRNPRWIGAGLGAAIAVSAVVLTPIAGAANDGHPTRVCVDNGSAGQCTAPTTSTSVAGSSGREVVVVRAPSGRLDAKDHPNYGSVTESSPGRIDAKDHPNYGSVTESYPGRIDAKDHPNYGSVTESSPGRTDAKDHPNYGPVSADALPPVHTPLLR
jgi:hypothetical protein